MSILTLFRIEWNAWNGFILTVLDIETKKMSFSRALFQLNMASSYVALDLLFIHLIDIDEL